MAARDSFYSRASPRSGGPTSSTGAAQRASCAAQSGNAGYADYRGNRQYLTLGNIADKDRVALFLMDYPHRRRMKMLARMTAHQLSAVPDLARLLATPRRARLPALEAENARLRDEREQRL